MPTPKPYAIGERPGGTVSRMGEPLWHRVIPHMSGVEAADSLSSYHRNRGADSLLHPHRELGAGNRDPHNHSRYAVSEMHKDSAFKIPPRVWVNPKYLGKYIPFGGHPGVMTGTPPPPLPPPRGPVPRGGGGGGPKPGGGGGGPAPAPRPPVGGWPANMGAGGGGMPPVRAPWPVNMGGAGGTPQPTPWPANMMGHGGAPVPAGPGPFQGPPTPPGPRILPWQGQQGPMRGNPFGAPPGGPAAAFGARPQPADPNDALRARLRSMDPRLAAGATGLALGTAGVAGAAMSGGGKAPAAGGATGGTSPATTPPPPTGPEGPSWADQLGEAGNKAYEWASRGNNPYYLGAGALGTAGLAYLMNRRKAKQHARADEDDVEEFYKDSAAQFPVQAGILLYCHESGFSEAQIAETIASHARTYPKSAAAWDALFDKLAANAFPTNSPAVPTVPKMPKPVSAPGTPTIAASPTPPPVMPKPSIGGTYNWAKGGLGAAGNAIFNNQVGRAVGTGLDQTVGRLGRMGVGATQATLGTPIGLAAKGVASVGRAISGPNSNWAAGAQALGDSAMQNANAGARDVMGLGRSSGTSAQGQLVDRQMAEMRNRGQTDSAAITGLASGVGEAAAGTAATMGVGGLARAGMGAAARGLGRAAAPAASGAAPAATAAEAAAPASQTQMMRNVFGVKAPPPAPPPVSQTQMMRNVFGVNTPAAQAAPSQTQMMRNVFGVGQPGAAAAAPAGVPGAAAAAAPAAAPGLVRQGLNLAGRGAARLGGGALATVGGVGTFKALDAMTSGGEQPTPGQMPGAAEQINAPTDGAQGTPGPLQGVNAEQAGAGGQQQAVQGLHQTLAAGLSGQMDRKAVAADLSKNFDQYFKGQSQAAQGMARKMIEDGTLSAEEQQQLMPYLVETPAAQEIMQNAAKQGSPDPAGSFSKWFENAPGWAKAFAFLGLPMAVIGMASSLFGNGGMGGMLMSVLGLGGAAAGLGFFGGTEGPLSGLGQQAGMGGVADYVKGLGGQFQTLIGGGAKAAPGQPPAAAPNPQAAPGAAPGPQAAGGIPGDANNDGRFDAAEVQALATNPQARSQLLQLDPQRQAQLVGQMAQADPNFAGLLHRASWGLRADPDSVYAEAAKPPYNLSKAEVDAMVNAYRAS